MVTDQPDAVRIPIVEETLAIEKRSVETGRVRVRTLVDEEQVTLCDTVRREHVEIERVAIGREVDTAPVVRDEGDFMVVPVFEERLVVERRFFLVEEIRLRRSTEQVPVELPATRRVMRAEVERHGSGNPNPSTSPT